MALSILMRDEEKMNEIWLDMTEAISQIAHDIVGGCVEMRRQMLLRYIL